LPCMTAGGEWDFMIAEIGRALFGVMDEWWSLRAPYLPAPETVVSIDNQSVYLRARSAAGDVASLEFLWREVSCICFRSSADIRNDAFYVLTRSAKTDADRCFVIPLDAAGCTLFCDAARARGLFPDELAILALTATKPGWYCWPSNGPPSAESPRHSALTHELTSRMRQ
jgi:hypothetical protein